MKKVNSNIDEELDFSQNIFGWEDETGVANSLYSTMHDIVLEGDLVFAYRGKNNGTSSLKQLIISRGFERTGDNIPIYPKKYEDDFYISVFTDTYSYVIPHTTLDYIKETILDDLESGKVDKKIIEVFKHIINNI